MSDSSQMKNNDIQLTSVVSGLVVGVLASGLAAGVIDYDFVAWLVLNMAWWGSIAFASGFCLALGAYVALRLVHSTTIIDTLLR